MANPYGYFPATYPGAYNPYQQMFSVQNQQGYQVQQQPSQQAQVAQQTGQIQNGGLVSVRSRAEAQNYPVAPGNSVTFKDETAPFVYTKTMGFSQLDRPVFETFRLVKEDDKIFQAENASKNDVEKSDIDITAFATKEELGAILTRIEALEAKNKTKKKESEENV